MRAHFRSLRDTAAVALSIVLGACMSSCTGVHVDSPLVHGRGDWPMLGRTASGMHSDPVQTMRLPLMVLWELDLPAGSGPGAAIAIDSVLVCTTLLGEFSIVNLMNGQEFGSKKLSGPIAGAPLSIGSQLYMCTEAGKTTIVDYDLHTGEFVWKKNIGGIAASPIVSHNRIVAGTLDGLMYALAAPDGEIVWKYTCDAPIHASPCADDSLIYCADTRGTVYALRSSSGTLAWKQTLNGAVYGGLSVVRGIVYAGSRSHLLYALDARTGTIRWTYDTGDRIMASVSSNDSLVVVCALNGSVAALTHAGVPLWKFSARGAVTTPGIILRDMVIVASLDSYVYALSIADGTVLWKQSIGARIKTTPIVWNGSLIVIGDKRTVYRFTSP